MKLDDPTVTAIGQYMTMTVKLYSPLLTKLLLQICLGLGRSRWVLEYIEAIHSPASWHLSPISYGPFVADRPFRTSRLQVRGVE